VSGALAIVIVIAAIIAVRLIVSLISGVTGAGIEVAGRAIGSAFKPTAPQQLAKPNGAVTLTRPAEEVRNELISAGALDSHSHCLTTSSGVAVELTVASGTRTLACWWDPAVVDKSTLIMADVLRAVRRIDPGAQVVL
jgi:hypothetical protein